MKVYIEYVLIDNFVIDYLLLKSAFVLTGKTPKRKRLFLCAFLGAIISLFFPLASFSIILSLVLRLICLALLTVLSQKTDMKGYLYFGLVFLGLTFLLGGSLIALFEAFKINYSSEICIAVMIVPAYLLLRIMARFIKTIFKRRSVTTNTYRTQLCLGDKKTECYGFFDTGNGVYLNDCPVVFCKHSMAKNLLELTDFKKIEFIEISTLAGSKRLPCIKLDSISIYFRDEPSIYTNVYVCITKVVGMSVDVILHPDLNGESGYETFKKTKKTS